MSCSWRRGVEPMTHNPREDIKSLIRSLIEEAGSRAAFDRWVDAAARDVSKPVIHRRRGRPRGAKHWFADWDLILLADELLRAESCSPTSAIKRVAAQYWRLE